MGRYTNERAGRFFKVRNLQLLVILKAVVTPVHMFAFSMRDFVATIAERDTNERDGRFVVFSFVGFARPQGQRCTTLATTTGGNARSS